MLEVIYKNKNDQFFVAVEKPYLYGANRSEEKGSEDYGAWLELVRDLCQKVSLKFSIWLVTEHNEVVTLLNRCSEKQIPTRKLVDNKGTTLMNGSSAINTKTTGTFVSILEKLKTHKRNVLFVFCQGTLVLRGELPSSLMFYQ